MVRKLSYTKWAPGQPNNREHNEHYLLLWLERAEWCDQPDISLQHVTYFVCEWDQSLEAAPTPPIGRWIEQRPDTPGGDRIRTFKPGGTLVFEFPKSGKRVVGSWRKDGELIYFSHPGIEENESPTIEKWFTISRRERQRDDHPHAW